MHWVAELDLEHRYKQLIDLMFPPDAIEPNADPSEYERLAVPHTFKPRLSLFNATVAVFMALVRIFSGSVLFACFGTLSWMTWVAIPNPALRLMAVLPIFVAFIVLLALLMMAVSWVTQKMSRRTHL